jgi:hypothetical protein
VSDLAAIRARAAEHETDLDRDVRYLTAAQLAERWSCHASTVRDIPRDELPYLEIGGGRAKHHRRYRPSDVAAYEARSR